MKILIVDDSKFNIITAQEVISTSGINCSTITANSGEEALNIIDSENVDIILLDIVMPGLTGIETLETIRKSKKNIIIIMFTSITDKKYLEKSFELGANDYVNKPIEPIEFIARLKSAIKLKEYQSALLESYVSLKEMNSELKESNSRLKRMQIELINKEKLATIGRFSAGIAHEINTPLGYITSNIYTINKYSNIFKENLEKAIDIIKINEADLKDIEAIKNLYHNNKNLEFMFEDFETLITETNEGLVKISKIIKNLRFSNEYSYQNFQVNKFDELIKEAVKVLNDDFGDKQVWETIDLKLELGEENLVKCNKFEIEQVIFNILKNAIYYIEKKDQGGSILVKTYIQDQYFCCDIKDDGIGIKEDIKDKIFDPFFTTKEIGEGMGLGLSICYNIIVDKHKGKLNVKSNYGEGTIFTIRLPKYEA